MSERKLQSGKNNHCSGNILKADAQKREISLITCACSGVSPAK